MSLASYAGAVIIGAVAYHKIICIAEIYAFRCT